MLTSQVHARTARAARCSGRRRLGQGAAALVISSAMALVTAVPAQAHSGHPGHGAEPATTAPTGPYGKGWRDLAPIAGGPRQEHAVAALGDDVYVLGGIVPDGVGGYVTTGRVEVYDTRRRTWTDAAPIPVAMNHPNVAAVDGKIYVIGALEGGASWEAIPDTYVYAPATDAWSELQAMPAGTERGSAAVGVRGTTIYLAGGMRTLTPGPGGLHDTVATVTAYDTATDSWSQLPDLPEARDHVGGAVVGDTLHVLGGRDRGQDNVRDDVFALDLTSRTWTELAPMPTPRGGIATAVVGTTIYTFGGEGDLTEGRAGVFDENEAYSTRSDSWQQLAPMPAPRHGTAATAIGRTIYMPGGGNATGGAAVDTSDSFRVRGSTRTG